MGSEKIYTIMDFLREEADYFKEKSAGLTYEEYSSNKDLKKILNSTLNDLVLAVVDLAGELLKKARKRVPNTYRDIILASRSVVGDIALKVAPLAKLRNESIHEYMNVNWKNIQFVRSSGIDVVEEFISKTEAFLSTGGKNDLKNKSKRR